MNGQISTAIDIPPCGVPQGSIGGHILWLLFSQMLFMSMRLIARSMTGVVEEVVDIIKDLMRKKVKLKLLVVS